MIRGPKSQDICYATENRQMAVKGVSRNSATDAGGGLGEQFEFQALVEVGQNYRRAGRHLVNDWSEVNPEWLEGVANVGVTAGASAPEHLVEKIVAALQDKGFTATGRSGDGGRGRAVLAASRTGERRFASATVVSIESVMSAQRFKSNEHAHLLPPQQKHSSAPPITCSRCSIRTATGVRCSPPIPRSNPITSCSSSGCIRPIERRLESAEPRPQIQRAVDRFSRQLPDGGFNIYVKGPSEISATVKAYFALKLAGVSCSDDHAHVAAARAHLALGGIQAANSYTKVNLSLFDLYPREGTPSIPPEIMLLPGKLLYQMSSWTRAIVVALAIVHAHESEAAGAGRIQSRRTVHSRQEHRLSKATIPG